MFRLPLRNFFPNRKNHRRWHFRSAALGNPLSLLAQLFINKHLFIANLYRLMRRSGWSSAVHPAVHRRACSFILKAILRILGMRILVLSDLHSNATALDAVLDAAQDRSDRSVCLGDVVGYGPDPNEVTERLRELGTQTIRGNHDKAVTGLMPSDDFNPVAKSAVDWTRAQLKPHHLP